MYKKKTRDECRDVWIKKPKALQKTHKNKSSFHIFTNKSKLPKEIQLKPTAILEISVLLAKQLKYALICNIQAGNVSSFCGSNKMYLLVSMFVFQQGANCKFLTRGHVHTLLVCVCVVTVVCYNRSTEQLLLWGSDSNGCICKSYTGMPWAFSCLIQKTSASTAS